ncbi:YceI family protein [Algoriphagus aquimarinus]|uniref:Polyisoprenoid-binding protein YceI n=1 Tax=Algoriphagus aquimarinus TaxID=237018 RepID=A0A1I1C544_9BACT|nr:YceI family protein [Algoriphagus aquimarinus]SFB56038.1 Polyisoprenoid-binding protein YceI [Algoriphagus aquimarinus]|tara:strand:- start:42303 stop:42830 length:528 start_codon:yes stop_codon:yes gene_type:complete
MSTTKWIIDPTHSEVSFKVKHLVISTVTGYFREFEGAAESSSDDFEGASVSFSSAISSIDTNQKDRDNHLKSADFFDAENHPKLTFSGKITKDGSDYKLVGDLTLRETTKNVEFNVDFGGVAGDPYGQTKAGFEIEGKINRKDFGLSWSAVTEAGSIVVSDQVRLILNIQLVKQA